MCKKTYYLTTPIYYVNDKPHIGHSYTTVLADTLVRYHRLFGDEGFLLTGTDEHGQKVQKAAAERNLTPQEHCDSTVVRFQEAWKRLNISNDDFIRTTEARHKKIVQAVLQDLFDRGLIYKAEYKGRYCVPCERFYTEKDLEGSDLCPDCKRSTNEITESNYFFKMSHYQDWLVDYIKTHPGFIQPSFRANETLGFLKRPLEDLCISRPKSRLAWGIELPFDKDYVCYVWFDALINYISAIGYGSDNEKFEPLWKNSHHLIGKDILTTHTVYWPTMLKAMNLNMPESIFAHGWWLMGQDKMSKSLGNVVNPMDMMDKYGVDSFRYFLMAEMSLGQDASFSEDSFITRYNSDLANDLGNLLNRVVKMTIKQFDGVIPVPSPEIGENEKELKSAVENAVKAIQETVENMKLDRGLESIMNAVRTGNRYMEKTAPWTLAKNGETEKLGTVLYTAAEALRIISGLLAPVMPAKMAELSKVLGLDFEETLESLSVWGKLKPGTKMSDLEALFMRIVKEEEKKPEAAAPKKSKPAEKKKEEKKMEKQPETAIEGVITIDDFFKAQLRTAKILAAEKVEGADKLLKLQIEIGEEKRQIVAGIALFYKPEDIIGRTIIVVANLKPAQIRGIESRGMLLAAKHGKELKLVTVDGEIASGASVG